MGDAVGAPVGAATKSIEMLALPGVELVTIELTVIRKELVPLKFGIVYTPLALSFATRVDGAYPVPVARLVTRT